MANKPEDSFWITNISKSDINLSDLNITIRAGKSINLLDKKHYCITKEQATSSVTSGSISKKIGKIYVRNVPPPIKKLKSGTMPHTIFSPSNIRSTVIAEKVEYDELIISDIDFAKENADLAEEDHLGKWGKKHE